MNTTHHHHQQNTRRRPLAEEAVARNNNAPPQPCPRCNSSNTKFCYYNNYSLSQPRYYCKDCRRYWTQGGALRNIPVGGGSRKSKRPKLSSSTTTATQPQHGGAPPISGGGFMSALASVSSFGFGPNVGLLYEMGLPDFQSHADLYMQQVFDQAGTGMGPVCGGTLPEPYLMFENQNPNGINIDNNNNNKVVVNGVDNPYMI